MPKIEDLIWCAGFFDGEGSVSIKSCTPSEKLRFQAKVCVTQVRPECLGVFLSNWAPSKIRSWKAKYNRKEIFEWSAVGKTAKQMLSDLIPYLRVKRDSAQTALEFLSLPWRSEGNTSGGIRVFRSKEQKFKDLEYAIKCASFNAKGSRNAERNFRRLQQYA
jgi:hypothetical protein